MSKLKDALIKNLKWSYSTGKRGTPEERHYYEGDLELVDKDIKDLALELIGDDEDLVTPENYAKFSKNDTALFYENRARDTRNKLRAALRKKVSTL